MRGGLCVKLTPTLDRVITTTVESPRLQREPTEFVVVLALIVSKCGASMMLEISLIRYLRLVHHV